jgi:hypothetical protein
LIEEKVVFIQKKSSAKTVTIGGAMTALAVLFQSAPVFLPSAGLALSPFSTLPIALAAIASPISGFISHLASSLLLLLISPQEAVIFFLTTGPLGLVLGTSFRQKAVFSAVIGAVALFVGIFTLTNAAGIAAFGGLTPDTAPSIETLIYLLFSIVYSSVWVFLLRFLTGFIGKADRLIAPHPVRNRVFAKRNNNSKKTDSNKIS